jgi:hypothetical protein
MVRSVVPFPALAISSLALGVIEKTLQHLKLWDRPQRPPPAAGRRTLHYDLKIRAWEDDVESAGQSR